MGTNTGIGIGIGIPFKNNVLGEGKPYLPPEIKDSLKAVVIAYGKTNNDSDRAIVKNLVDASNPFVISNAAFKLNSGFGKYEVDFTTWSKVAGTSIITDSKYVLTDEKAITNGGYFLWNRLAKDSFKVKISNIPNGGWMSYRYRITEEDTQFSSLFIREDGIYTLPATVAGSDVDFFISTASAPAKDWVGLTITQIPSFEGAFVTDGVNDLITSTKTVQEMLGGSNEITVVSMIHGIGSKNAYTNVLRESGSNYIRNTSTADGKTGIYGYTSKDTTKSIITDILGDKNDYKLEYIQTTTPSTINSVFGVAGWRDSSFSMVVYPVAWYWTIIANKVLTTDQINQVIAYFNLDRTLKPDILCDVKKQGITNENHAEFGDKLIDFSGNGRDIQLNNLAWDGDSGIGKYAADFTSWTTPNGVQKTSDTVKITTEYTENWVAYLAPNNTFKSMKVLISGIPDGGYLQFFRTTADGGGIKMVNGINEIPEFTNTVAAGFYIDVPLGFDWSNLVIEQIPSHAGALCLDGVNDFGKVTGMPVYKDYTVVADREIIDGLAENADGGVALKGSRYLTGAFCFDYKDAAFSFGTPKMIPLDTKRFISYQSKYVSNGIRMNIGTATDNDELWIGRLGNDERYSKIAIRFLMSFPYSMSEFLIERQLKKHKLGTLYPDMVEFRPVIKKDDRIKSIKYYIDGKIANIGQYYPIGSGLGIAVETVQPYMVKSLKVNGVNTIPNADYKGFNARLDSKSPQKITMDIQVDTNLIQWNPIITSTAELTTAPTFAIRGTSTLLKAGDWIPKNSEIWVIVTMNNLIDELRKFSFNGTFIHIPSSSYNPNTGKYGFPFVIDNESPQNINLTIDEYIRYEDIVQPYPILLGLRDENDNEVSWGDKLRVGSTATFTRGLKDSDLLYGMYKIDSIWLNNENMIVVADGRPLGIEKKMEFRSAKEWLLDNNEPKCILSPRLLRIPNSSYKILGHIPDISGHGNHGKINNSAYAGASGANGYLQNFSGWTKASGVSSTDSVISSSNNLVAANGWIAYVTSGTVVPTFKVEISGIPINGNLRFEGSGQTLVNGVNTIQGLTTTKISGFYISNGYDNDWSNLRIEQVGEYEGAYCLDGVDDFVTIPTLSSGGKQVLMKVNWNTIDSIIYDQRGSGGFAIYCSDYNNPSDSIIPAYKGRNAAGTTYIDGIRNEYIIASQLRNVTHNIVEILDTSYAAGNINPIIGKSHMNSNYGNLALYDFMLFDDISTDDKIKQLNEYVGIEAKVELPPYYWDAYGKTNLDADKATIQQRGVAVGDYDLTNTNFAYDKMSGFGGYEFEKFTDTTKWIETKREDGIEVIEKNDYSFTAKKVGTGQYFWDFKNNSIKTLDRDLTVKAISNNNVYIRWEFKYRTAEKPDIDSAIILLRQAMTPNVPITVTLPYKTQEEQTELGVVEGSTYYLFYFDPIDIPVGDEYTVEMLPLYPNGLVYDAITDYSENVNIPVFTDFTAIMKRKWLKNQGCPLIKGSKVYEGGNGNALLFEWDKAYNFVFYKRTDIMEGKVPENISFITPTNYNGNVITRGSGQDINGICIAGDGNAGFANIVFYKLILYPKTIPLLQINFLKNLMEKDEIIDLNNPIFIKNE